MTTLAGSGTAQWADGVGTAARFKNPFGVCVDANGAVIIADSGNNRIRKIISSGEKLLCLCIRLFQGFYVLDITGWY